MKPAHNRQPCSEDLTARKPPGEVEDELARFFEQSPDLLCVAGLDGYFKRLNPAWTVLLAWTLEELAARPFLDFTHPDDRAATTAELAKLAEGGPAVLFENRYRKRNAGKRGALTITTPGGVVAVTAQRFNGGAFSSIPITQN